MSAILNLSIDLSKVDKSKLVDGKYLNTQIFINDDSKFGNNVSMAYSQSKEQREAKEDKVYVGGGKEFIFGGNEQPKQQAKSQPKAAPIEDDDSLPF